MSAPDLLVDFCSHEAAKYAVLHWHYSRRMPKGKLVKLGVWEDGEFVGAVIFGRGANRYILAPFGLDQTEGCELVRVALKAHRTPTTKIVALAMKRLKEANPGLRLVVSYADPEHGHHGGLYQAGNWIYTGKTGEKQEFIIHGRRVHTRTLSSTKDERFPGMLNKQVAALLDPDFEIVKVPPKHRYVYPLDRAMRRQVVPLAQPYPKPERADV